MLVQRLARRAARTRREIATSKTAREAYQFIHPPAWPGMRLSPKRLLNLYLARYQRARGHTKLLARPLVLTLEASNVCNLRCPYCFTGVGEVTRERSMMPMPLYRKIMDELGAYALLVEYYNWGEPLLNKRIDEMVRIASRKGCSTIVSTNLSIPLDQARAEALVSSGLAILGAGIDGASQESYEKYRVGGSFELVLHNMRLLAEAKRRLGSDTPMLCWSFHVFDHNKHEVEKARAIAKELGVEFSATKGWVEGPDWDSGSEIAFPVDPPRERCRYLWTQAVINNDGSVSPCANSFYQEDDFGSMAHVSFRDVWNNKHFQEARRLYRARGASEHGRRLVCHDCPYTIIWENYQRHLAQGLPESSFDPVYTTNDWFNYFFSRRRTRRDVSEPAAVIDVQAADTRTSRSP
jgi:radical SAM protein with 4Fe4S-binding SPASM domain